MSTKGCFARYQNFQNNWFFFHSIEGIFAKTQIVPTPKTRITEKTNKAIHRNQAEHTRQPPVASVDVCDYESSYRKKRHVTE